MEGARLQFFRIFWWQIARNVRRHRLLALCNVLSIALGIAVYLAIRIANESATRAFSAGVDLVAGRAHLEIRGDVNETLWPELERHPEVEAVTGVIEAIATIPGKPGEYLRLIGVDVITGESFRTFELRADAGRPYDVDAWLGTPNGVAVPAAFASRNELQLRSTFSVRIDGREEQLKVVAILEEGAVPLGSRYGVMDLGWMQEMIGRLGRLTSLQVRLKHPERAEQVASALQLVARGLSVAPPEQRSAQVGKMLAAFQLNLTALSLVSLLVGVFLVYNTVSTSVARRRVQIGIVRSLGMTPFGVRALFLGEAIFYAIPGIIVGCIGGVLLAGQLAETVEKTVTSLYTLVDVERLSLSGTQFAVAAIYGIVASLVGAWGPAAEAARVDPVQVLRRGTGEVRAAIKARRWWMNGVLALVLASACAAAALAGAPRWLAFASAFFVLVGAAGFAPAIIQLIAIVTVKVSGNTGTLRIAARKLGSGLRRNAITVGALAAAVAMFVALVVMVHSFRRSLDAWIGKGIVADLFVAPAANEVLGLNSFLPSEAVEWLRKHPNVAAADTFRELPVTIFGEDGPEQTLLAVVDGAYRENLTFLEGNEREAAAKLFAGEAVLASEPFARRLRIGAGDSVLLESANGPVSVNVAGVYADYARDQGYLLMSHGLFMQLRNDPRVMSAAVYLREGADTAAIEKEFRAAIPGEWAIHTSRTLRERILKIFDQTFAVTLVLRTVAVVVAVTGVLLTMLTLVLERRRELALLRALGGTRSFVGWLVTAEAALLGLASAVLGLLAGLPLAMVLTWVVNPTFFGWTIQFQIPWETLVWTPVWITAVAMLAAWWPARVARQVGIAEALHEE